MKGLTVLVRAGGWCLLILFCGCEGSTSGDGRSVVAPDDTKHSAIVEPSLKLAFADFFQIGTALSEDQIMGRTPAALETAAYHFNAVTAENSMKWEEIQPLENKYRWEVSDALVAFCSANKALLTGHALVWHHQTPDWVFENADGSQASRELLLKRMEAHINAVVGRYKGVIPSWDVVNEALNEDGTMRDSKWRKIIGDDYIELAFEFAHKADPNAELYYNDYNLFKPEKRAAAVALVKRVQAKGIPVHGIGMQGHYGLGYPNNLSDIENTIIAFSKLGTVMITELDISVLPFPDEGNEGADIGIDMDLMEKYNPYVNGLPADVQAAYIDHYKNIFEIYLNHKDKVSRVTFWGVNDAQSWRNDWPMQGRTDYPLLIDRDNQLKPVAHALIKQAQLNSTN